MGTRNERAGALDDRAVAAIELLATPLVVPILAGSANGLAPQAAVPAGDPTLVAQAVTVLVEAGAMYPDSRPGDAGLTPLGLQLANAITDPRS